MSRSRPLSVYQNSIAKFARQILSNISLRRRNARKHMAAIEGVHEGRKAVIVCNGPSLLRTDLSLLQGMYSFGLNKINLLFDKTDWRPNSIVAVNPHVLEQNSDFFNETDCQLYLSDVGAKTINDRKNICLMNTRGSSGVFSKNCRGRVTEGHTVTYVAMQLAFHMGFSRVALVGCDHNFSSKGPANKAVQAGAIDHDHFDPNYFSGGVTWDLPDLVRSELHYQIAAAVYSEDERLLVNCTEGGELELFPRLSLDKFKRL